MGCRHCRERREAIERAWGDEITKNMGHPTPTGKAEIARLFFAHESDMDDCECECHIPARIVGWLPRLKVS